METASPPSPCVWTGDKGYRCSGTWVTPFRVGSKRIPDLMLLRRLWGCGHRSCDVHKSTGRCVERPQINPADALNAVMDVENPIVTTRPQRYGLPAERLANADRSVPEADPTVTIDLANDVARPILDRRQTLAEHAWTGAITSRRRLQAERLMGPLMIVERSSRAPTGSFSECLFIPGIHGSGCRLRSTRRSTKRMALFTAAR